MPAPVCGGGARCVQRWGWVCAEGGWLRCESGPLASQRGPRLSLCSGTGQGSEPSDAPAVWPKSPPGQDQSKSWPVFLLEGFLKGSPEGQAQAGACSLGTQPNVTSSERRLWTLEHCSCHHSSTRRRGTAPCSACHAQCPCGLGAPRGKHTGETRLERGHSQPERSGR